MTFGRILFLLSFALPSVASAQVCVKPKVLILLDISGSMLDSTGSGTKYAQAKQGIANALDSLDSNGRFGLQVFPSTPTQTQPSGYCWTSPNLAVPYADSNRAAISAFLDASGNQPKSSYNTPIYQALSNVAYLTDTPDMVLLITDGTQDCPGGTDYGDYDSYPDRSPNTITHYGPLVEEAQNKADLQNVTMYLAANNIRTFAIGFSAGADTDVLDAIATAGNTTRSYQANNTSDLTSTLQTILYHSSTEVCNGIDDDCNGVIDDGPDGYQLEQACSNGCGTQVCQNGQYTACRQPTQEECNNLDDNCDGVVDNLPIFQCQAGTAHCDAGQWYADDAEICDNMDNDCDGIIDNGLDCQCNPGDTGDCGQAPVGACTPNTYTCQSDHHWPATCPNNGVQPTAEVCNGIDDNCNGFVDDIDGACNDCQGRPGHAVCKGNQTVCEPTTLVLDTCNGLDDDCDGQIDEDGDVQTTGQCGPGVQHCINGKLGPIEYTQLPAEVCNGRDDNCDGRVDENCDCQHGSTAPCDAEGQTMCGMGGVKKCEFGRWTSCVGTDTGAPEVCDGQDQNCNGQVDEGATCPTTGESCVCGHCVPACKPDGTCDNGAPCINGMCEIGGCDQAAPMAAPSGPAPQATPTKAALVRGGCDCAGATPVETLWAYALLALATYFARRRYA